LLKQYGWGIDKVTKHQDYSGKYCPHKTLDLGWQRFVNMVKEELDKLNGTTTSATTSNTSGLEAYSGYVEVTYGGSDGLSYHNKPSWADSTVAGVAKKGDVFTVVGRIKVDGTYMYKLKSGNYITSASKYVTFRKDLHGSSGSTASASSSKSYAGKAVKLSKKPVYASASSKSSSGTLTGTYYYWNNEVINGRIRVTNAKSRVGVKGQVTGWIQL
jgi:N-acetylmuramoyl-L-alanine amidase